MTAVWLTAAGQRTDLADSNRCEAEVRRARTRVSNGSRGAVRRLDRLGRKADVEVTRPTPDVRLLRQPARSIGDRAGSLPAELSIDWKTRLEGDGDDLLHRNRRIAAVGLDLRRGRQGRGVS